MNGKCGHCGLIVLFLPARYGVDSHVQTLVFECSLVWISDDEHNEASRAVQLSTLKCPHCGRSTIAASTQNVAWPVWPRLPAERRLDPSIPKELQKDYTEASLVATLSTNASAALARRCLQTLLTLQGSSEHDLSKQIQQMKDRFPSHVEPFVDKIRQIGNLAAHAKAHQATAEIIDVDPHEAEWLLALLDELFDHFYVKPAASKAKAQAVEAKLASLGKVKR